MHRKGLAAGMNMPWSSVSLPCQLNKLLLNMTFWTKLLNKNPLKQKSIEQHTIEQKVFRTIGQLNQTVFKKGQLNISWIEQKSNWTSNYWTISQLNTVSTEHWTIQNWSSGNWTYYIWTKMKLNKNQLNTEQEPIEQNSIVQLY